eukprot:TRINITY_DN3883_c0_g1_i1.p1 TRINITY_DN3883_c0_g1~~TRINITY_DN3883_c0_g1_i1.p1  ORF type:complete len:189 (+),score=39.34 TRINITY_DN3883_c0_g1_i1:57-569(+)
MQWEKFKFKDVVTNLKQLQPSAVEPTPPSFMDEWNDMTKITWKQRMTMSVVLALLGAAFLGLSTVFLFNPKLFAKFYTIGSLMLIGSSTSLIGVKKQIATISASTARLYAASIYAISIFVTLYAALSLKSSLLTIISVGFQLGAVVWYMVTYIPMGNSILLRGAKMLLPF